VSLESLKEELARIKRGEKIKLTVEPRPIFQLRLVRALNRRISKRLWEVLLGG
jgi:antitoxin (DNA-binding transcriptional repressor) of toxin-antitoxin stability system